VDPVVASWSVRARNLPEHAGNSIHTDEGARAAGFPSALVAGVTTYAYLTHPIVAAWGLDWVATGGAEVRFDAPVFAGDELRCTPITGPDSVVVQAEVGSDRAPRAALRATRLAAPCGPARSGEVLAPRRVELAGQWGADYGERAGDDLAVYTREGVVHPAVWPALANHLVAAELVRGSWIHVRSLIRHQSLAAAGSTAEIAGLVVDRFHRRTGERAIVEVTITVDGRPVASLEHEAIIALGTADER
jgi:acyl dehydratase